MRYKLILIFVVAVAMVRAQEKAVITFKLKADNESLSKAGLGIRGSLPPLSWEKTTPLSDADGDGVYEAAITFNKIQDLTYLEYKYISDKTWEDTPNRFLWFGAPGNLEVDVWGSVAPPDPSIFPKIPAAKAKEDFKLLRQAFQELHPGLTRYRTESELFAAFDELESGIQQDLTVAEAYLLFSKAAALVKCGHTYANFYNQPGVVQQLVFNQADKLPFTFKWVNKKMIVLDNFSDKREISRGTEIAAINGIPVSTILDELRKVVKADGNNDGKRIYDLNLTGWGAYEAFDIYFPLLFPPKDGKFYDITLAENETHVLLESMTREGRKKFLQESAVQQQKENNQNWMFSMLQPQTAYLRLPSFATWEMDLDWKKFLKNSFEEMQSKGAQTLILDIRGNEGGNDEVILSLVKYIANKPVRSLNGKSLVRYRKIPPSLAPNLRSWDRSYLDLTAQTKSAAENGFYPYKSDDDLIELPAQPGAFSGKIFLLVDAGNSSATFILARFLKENGLATLVGQTTGGSLQGTNGGKIAFLQLPNSQIEVDIPLIGSFYETQSDGGVQPDILVQETVEDVVKGRDAVLEKVKEK